MSVSFKEFIAEMTKGAGKPGKSVYISAGSSPADARTFQAAYPDNLYLYDKKLSTAIDEAKPKIHKAIDDIMDTDRGDWNKIKVHDGIDIKYIAYAPGMSEVILGVEGKMDLMDNGGDEKDMHDVNYACVIICHQKGFRHIEVYGQTIGDESPAKGKWPYAKKEMLALLKSHEEGHYDDLIEILKG